MIRAMIAHANTAILRSQFSGLSHGSDAEQSLNARCSELVLMRVYFTQQQQILKKKKGAKFLDRACVRCGCAIQVADGAIKAASSRSGAPPSPSAPRLPRLVWTLFPTTSPRLFPTTFPHDLCGWLCAPAGS